MSVESTQSARQRLVAYYDDLRPLFESLTGKSGFYNLGWLPEKSKDNFADGQRQMVGKVVTPLNAAPPGIVLDVGSGQAGPASFAAQTLGRIVVGLEMLRAQHQAAIRYHSSTLKLLQGDACSIPLRSSSMSGVYSIESAFHYLDKAAFISECARVLRPGGVLSLADIVWSGGRFGIGTRQQFERALSAPNLFTQGQYLNAAEKCGLKLVESFDLTPGAARSFAAIRPLISEFRRHITKSESKRLRLPLLQLATILAPLLHSTLRVRYIALIFHKA